MASLTIFPALAPWSPDTAPCRLPAAGEAPSAAVPPHRGQPGGDSGEAEL